VGRGDCNPGWGKSQGSYYSQGCKVGQPSVARGLKGNPIRVEGQQPWILGLLRLFLIMLPFHCLHAEMERRYASGQRKFASDRLIFGKIWKPVPSETDSPFLAISLSVIIFR
jgi:hypothetical protein